MSRPLVVTGPTGWIGRALLDRLTAEGDLARVRLFGSRGGSLAVGGTTLPMRPLAGISGADTAGAEVVHLAYLTLEKVDQLGEAAFVATNRAIDAALLAACAAGPPHAVFVASSGAARLAGEGDPHPYGRLKREQERAFLRYGARAGVPVLAARLFNLAGPHVNKVSSYALSAFLVQGLRERRIAIAADRPVWRAYLHVDDLARMVLRALEQATGSSQPEDLCGAEALEMADIARAAAEAIGLDLIAIERPPLTAAPPSRYLGDPGFAARLAADQRIPLAPFARQVRDTAAFLAGSFR